MASDAGVGGWMHRGVVPIGDVHACVVLGCRVLLTRVGLGRNGE
jgi:hypothetical protein